MATIRELDSGSWQALVRKKNANPVYKTFKKEAEAIRWAQLVEDQIERGIFPDGAIRKIPLKDGEGDIDPTWVKAWCEVYWADDVEVALQKCRLWCLDNPSRRKTRRGLRRFLGAWIRRDCRLKPQVRMVTQKEEPRPVVSRETRASAIAAMREAIK